jgi:S1-C subfamily serine protease
MKKLLKIFLVLVLCISTTGLNQLCISEKALAATNKKVEMSSSFLKIAVGDSAQLTLNGASGTIHWKSSDKSIAKVSTKGKISALSRGSVKIIATNKGKSYYCKVKVTMKVLYSTADSLTIFQPTKIIISSDLDPDTIYYNIDNTGIVSGSFGEWVTHDSIELFLKPKKAGTTKLRITSKYSDQELVIPVTVVSDTNYDDKDAMTAKQIYAKCKSATAQVTTDLGLGSGFYVAKGKLITNYHVIKNASDIKVMNTDGNTYQVKEILGYDETLDIAVLSVSCTNNDILALNTHGLTTGEDVFAFGNPLGLTDTFTSGVVENTNRTIDSQSYIQSSAPISPGNSGGALVNAFGEVVGINSAIFTDGQNINLAIPINKIYSVDIYEPILLADYAKQSLQNAISEKTITEDASLSHDFSTAQTANIGYYVHGTLQLSETATLKGDLYKFVVATTGYYELQVYDQSGRNGLYICLVTEEQKYIDVNEAPFNFYKDYGVEDGVFYLVGYIPAGTYYINVFKNSDVAMTNDVEYKAAIVAED